MAKIAKVKKREVSFRSRAARRGASPPAKDVAAVKKAAPKETEYKPWLHNAQNAGITKKQKMKPIKRQQKVRQQRAMEKADAVVDKLERKVADSKARSKRIQSRAKAWEELNAKPATAKTNEDTAVAGAEDKDGDVDIADVEGARPADNTIPAAVKAPTTLPAPADDADLNEVT